MEELTIDDHISGRPLRTAVEAIAAAKTEEDVVGVIIQVLESKNLHIFGELLDQENTLKLRDSESGREVFSLLELFSYGTYRDYLIHGENLPSVTPEMLRKLQRLTFVSICLEGGPVGYEDAMARVGVDNVRELEDLVIECVYSGLVKGKLNAEKQIFIVEDIIGRDVPPAAVTGMLERLGLWESNVESHVQRLKEMNDEANEGYRKKKEEANLLQEKEKEDELLRMKKRQRLL